MNGKSEEALLKKWQAVREVREAVTAAIEPLRADKSVGSSLQAEVAVTAPDTLAGYLKALGEELRFALLVSEVSVAKGDELTVAAKVSGGEKCERCWHYTDDVGSVAAHPHASRPLRGKREWQRRNETLRLNAEVVKGRLKEYSFRRPFA